MQAGERRLSVVEELADAHDLTEAATMTAGATCVGDEALLEDEDRSAGLEQLHRGIGGAGGPQQRRFAIAARPCPLSTALEEVVVVDAAVGADAVREQRGGQAREGLDLLRHRARERQDRKSVV